jgi:hypothetical protein
MPTMIDDSWIKIIFLAYFLIIALGIGIISQLFKRKLRKEIVIILTLQECEVLKDICMEFLGNYKWKVNTKRALVLNKILDKIEEVKK